jgi:hypothetical protein
MSYEKQTWVNRDLTKPLNDGRMNHIEDGIFEAAATADAALAAAGGKLEVSAAPELIRDTMGTALVAGSNVTITPNDAGDTLTIASSGGGGPVDAVTSPTVGRIVAVLEGETPPTLQDGDLVVYYAAESSGGGGDGADYYYDWETDTESAAPAGWSALWGSATWDVVSGITGGTGKVLRFSAAGSGRFALTANAVDADPDRADIEFLYRYKQASAASAALVPLARASGASAAENGYRAGHYDGTKIRISEYVAGATASLAELGGLTNTNGTWYRARFRIEGVNLMVKKWNDLDAEPGSWMLTIADASIVDAGRAGLLGIASATTYVDWIAIATGGRTAVVP